MSIKVIIYYTNIFLQNESAYIKICIYHLHQTQQYDLKKIKTRSKDPLEDIVVLPAGTIFVIRQRLALKRDY